MTSEETQRWDKVFLETKRKVLEDCLDKYPLEIFSLELDLQSKQIKLEAIKNRLKKISEELLPEINEKLKLIGEIKND